MIKELIGHNIPPEINDDDHIEEYRALIATHRDEFTAKAHEMGFNIPVETVLFREQDLASDGQIPTHFLIQTVGTTDRSVLEEHDVNLHTQSLAELAEGCLSLVKLYSRLRPGAFDPDTGLEEFFEGMMQSRARMHMVEGPAIRLK